MGGGLFLKFGMPKVFDETMAFLPLPSRSFDNSHVAGVTSVPTSVPLDDVALSDLAPTLNVGIIVLWTLGIFMFVVGLLGCIGSCCSARFLLAPV